MSEATQGAPAAAPESTAAEGTTQTPAVVQQEAGSEGQQPPAAKPELTEEQRRLRSLERKLDKAYRINARQHMELEGMRRGGGNQQQPAPGGEGADGEERFTRQQVQEILQQQRSVDDGARALTSGIQKAVQAGAKAYPDFDQKTNELIQAVDLIGPGNQPTALLENILDCEKSHEVIHHLANNLDLAEEIAELTPRQQIKRLAQLETELAAKPKTSAAPKPLAPVKATATSDDEPDPANVSAWIEWDRKRNAGKRQR